MRNFKMIIIHCSDSDIDQHDNIEEVKKWHVEENGWSDVGYHFFVRRETGGIQVGRPLRRYGAHTEGHNGSIGVCLHGSTWFSAQQLEATSKLIKTLRYLIGNDLKVHPHNFFNKSKTCPNFPIELLSQKQFKDYYSKEGNKNG